MTLAGTPGEQGPPGEQGEPGEPGSTGPPGADGLHCWDENADGVCDPDEDINGDTFCDTFDCHGPQGDSAVKVFDAEDNFLGSLVDMEPATTTLENGTDVGPHITIFVPGINKLFSSGSGRRIGSGHNIYDLHYIYFENQTCDPEISAPYVFGTHPFFYGTEIKSLEKGNEFCFILSHPQGELVWRHYNVSFDVTEGVVFESVLEDFPDECTPFCLFR